jgi:tetratricopeptide (TPR) repeat protein
MNDVHKDTKDNSDNLEFCAQVEPIYRQLQAHAFEAAIKRGIEDREVIDLNSVSRKVDETMAALYCTVNLEGFQNPNDTVRARAAEVINGVYMNVAKPNVSEWLRAAAIDNVKKYYREKGTNTLSWLLIYRVTNDCNGVLDNIDNAEGSQSERDRIKGQALALRGFLYLHLASCYSFAIDKDPDAVCGPIYTKSTDTETAAEGQPASSVSEVYAQAISDLEEALSLIPTNYVRSSKQKIDTQVVLGILSRACLYARQFEKAKMYSDQLLAKNNYLMNEAEFGSGFSDISNGEWIWGHPQTADQGDFSYLFNYLDTTSPTSYYYSFNVDPYFRDLYNDGDYRKDLIQWGTDPGATVKEHSIVWMRNKKFRFRDVENKLADIILMRVAEIYLINAEAKAQLNDPDAVNVLNTLN